MCLGHGCTCMHVCVSVRTCMHACLRASNCLESRRFWVQIPLEKPFSMKIEKRIFRFIALFVIEALIHIHVMCIHVRIHVHCAYTVCTKSHRTTAPYIGGKQPLRPRYTCITQSPNAQDAKARQCWGNWECVITYLLCSFLKCIFSFLFVIFVQYSKCCSKNIRDHSKIEITQTWQYNYIDKHVNYES